MPKTSQGAINPSFALSAMPKQYAHPVAGEQVRSTLMFSANSKKNPSHLDKLNEVADLISDLILFLDNPFLSFVKNERSYPGQTIKSLASWLKLSPTDKLLEMNQASDGLQKVFRFLADSNTEEYDRRNLLCVEYKRGNYEFVKERLDLQSRGEKIEDFTIRCVGTPLYWAVHLNAITVVKALLAQDNLDPNKPVMDDRTPLLWAAFLGRTEAVKALLDHPRIDVNKADYRGTTALDEAVRIRMATIEAERDPNNNIIAMLLSRKEIKINPERKYAAMLTKAKTKAEEINSERESQPKQRSLFCCF